MKYKYSYELWVKSYVLRVMSYKFWVNSTIANTSTGTSYNFCITCYKLWVTSSELQVTSYDLLYTRMTLLHLVTNMRGAIPFSLPSSWLTSPLPQPILSLGSGENSGETLRNGLQKMPWHCHMCNTNLGWGRSIPTLGIWELLLM